MKQVAFEQAQRRARVVHAWLAGDSARSIAADLQLSVGTVHRILQITPGVREERTRRDQETLAELSQTCAAWSADHIGEPLSSGAHTLGIPVAQLRRLLGPRVALHPEQRSSTRGYSDEELLERLREWMVMDGVKTAGDYQAAAAVHGWPTKATVIARFGSWTQALRAAGFDAKPRPGDTKRWTDANLADILTHYFAEDRPWSHDDLTTWLKASPERPSIALLRQRIGPWPALVQRGATPRQQPAPRNG